MVCVVNCRGYGSLFRASWPVTPPEVVDFPYPPAELQAIQSGAAGGQAKACPTKATISLVGHALACPAFINVILHAALHQRGSASDRQACRFILLRPAAVSNVRSAREGHLRFPSLASLSSLDRFRASARCLPRGQKTGSACVHEIWPRET